LVVCGCSVLGCANAGHRQELEHYDPVALNELAVEKVREGQLTTAWILLERAARLAPHDARLARNLAVLRAFRAGTPTPSVAEPSAPSRAAGSNGVAVTVEDTFSQPPAIWKIK
jgi:Flp pilus assembly protein TadD